MQMNPAYQAVLWGALLVFAAYNCTDDQAMPPPTEPLPGDGAQHIPTSIHYFSEAEQKLAIKEYTFAAALLNKGIVAYRAETGKMCCGSAEQSNKAIDVLIQLRQKLRKGKPVMARDLRVAIQQALLVEGWGFPQRQTSGNETPVLPVGN